ncbi:hypothetical protein ACLB2K_028312 [Fragaria x ananassa]
MNIADESAWVGTGAILGELYYSIAQKRKVHAFPGGVCPSVGLGGLFSGGGYGPMMRKFGLTVDNIEDATLVNVNGTILDRKSMVEDLFWAIRGGGGASFGVILSWKIKLVQVPPIVTVFTVTKTLEQGAADVLHRTKGKPSFFASGTPIKALVKRSTQPPPFFLKGKSDYVKRPISKEILNSIFDKMMNMYETTHMQWNPYGGRMNEISESETPFPHRSGNLFMIQYWTYWMEKGIENTNKYLNLSRNLYESMNPYVSKSPRDVLQNYRDLDIGSNVLDQNSIEHARVYGRSYFKGNFERLVRAKSAIDPQNFIVLDMFNHRSININLADESALVQSGATLGEIYYAISTKSKVHGFPAGVCLTLGAGGHFTGGGYGNMMRKYGLSVDNIVDAQIVNVNGEILDRKSMGEDLFWAIRGGGAASFGVILAWKIKLAKVPEKVTVFQVDRTLEQGATDIVVQWQKVADNIDNDLFIRVMLAPGNGSREGEKTIKVTFVSLFLGDSARLLRLLNQSLPQLGLQQKDCIEMSCIESIMFWAGYPNGTSLDVLLSRVPKGMIYLKRKSDCRN